MVCRPSEQGSASHVTAAGDTLQTPELGLTIPVSEHHRHDYETHEQPTMCEPHAGASTYSGQTSHIRRPVGFGFPNKTQEWVRKTGKAS